MWDCGKLLVGVLLSVRTVRLNSSGGNGKHRNLQKESEQNCPCHLHRLDVRCGSTGQRELPRPAHIHVSVSNGTDGTATEHHVLGWYGLRSLTVPVSGTLVHVQTVDEARHGCSQYNHSLPSHDWIALIERGRCMFTEKIRIAAKQFNASGVIIYNNQAATDTPIIISPIEDEVYVAVSTNDGRRLALMVDSGAHVHVQITPGDVSSSAWYRWSSGVSYLLVCIAVFLLSLG